MPWVESGPDGNRRLRTWDLDLNGGQRGPLAVPGVYTARITVGDHVLEAPVEVLKDPHSAGTLDDIRRQVAMSLRMRGDLDRIGGMIDRLEWIREQVEDAQAYFAKDSAASATEQAAKDFRARLLDVEGRLFDIHLSGAREDAFRNPMKLYGRMSALASDVGASSSDFPPTDQQAEVHGILLERLEEASRLMDALLAEDLPALNARLAERSFPVISDREE
jgi:hypothetical protein